MTDIQKIKSLAEVMLPKELLDMLGKEAFPKTTKLLNDIEEHTAERCADEGDNCALHQL